MVDRTTVHLKNAVRHWIAAVASAPGRTIILSPFVTSPTAGTVIRDAAPSDVEIYTLFDALNFASGASSIRTLRKLAERGCHLYHLPGLHAKLVFVPETWAALGSQNLTRRGTRNKEASTILTEPRVLSKLAKQLEKWMPERVPITLDMILDMEDAVGPLSRTFRQLAKAAASLDAQVHRKAVERQERLHQVQEERAERKRSEEKARAEAVTSRLRNNIARIALISASREGRVEVKSTGQWGSSATWSLSAAAGDDWTRWHLGGKPLQLQRITRYLTLAETTGRIGWSRIAKTRITFVADAVHWTQALLIAGLECRMHCRAEWDEEKIRDGNLAVALRVPGYQGSVSLRGWFSVSDLEIWSISIEEGPRDGLVESLVRSIETDEQSVRRSLIDRLLTPFDYRHRLTGVEANKFFGPAGSRHRIRLAQVNGSPLVVVTSQT